VNGLRVAAAGRLVATRISPTAAPESVRVANAWLRSSTFR
jgi:hypothetical protein